ncbi:hypothetical protein [Actinosynnema sp. NPDC020468]|uniref:hypothetical protein n=1 Tax=Actinosynnema sp. NPDC020468 TaxID=3154488 RepID=UPI0033EAABFB
MSNGRRTALVGLMAVLAIGALVFMVITVNRPRPVDVRRVDAAPTRAGELSATFTTTLQVAKPTTTAVPPPATDVPVDETEPATTTRKERGHGTHRTVIPVPPWCGQYQRTGQCLPWLFPVDVKATCDWLRDQGLLDLDDSELERLGLDVDLDGLGCDD